MLYSWNGLPAASTDYASETPDRSILERRNASRTADAEFKRTNTNNSYPVDRVPSRDSLDDDALYACGSVSPSSCAGAAARARTGRAGARTRSPLSGRGLSELALMMYLVKVCPTRRRAVGRRDDDRGSTSKSSDNPNICEPERNTSSEDSDSDYKFSQELQLFDQKELNDLVRGLNLSKEASEILASHLKEKNLLTPESNITFDRNRE
ncbi:hypothetical protein EVAR_42521_1 [Eumeta japonica]|uniref:Uncharacterized protein n=1 Tax=Eumeta variegata TaxID=151549 RepID=A0A4C1XG92_EUMVA|nr:hypothetical protein EVAR_42521_1 [Eumeta japonica]